MNNLSGDGSSARKSSAQKNCSTPFEQLHRYMQLLKNKKVSFWADASFRPKCRTARIATARQKHWKMSTAQIKKSWKSGTCTAVRLKKVEKSGTYTAVRLKNRVS